MRVEDGCLPAELLEVRTFLEVPQVNPFTPQQPDDALRMCSRSLLLSELGEGHDVVPESRFGECSRIIYQLKCVTTLEVTTKIPPKTLKMLTSWSTEEPRPEDVPDEHR